MESTKTLIIFLSVFSILFSLTISKVEIYVEKSFFHLNFGDNVISFKIKNFEKRERDLVVDIFPSIFNKISCSLNQYFVKLRPYEEKELKILCKVPYDTKEVEFPMKIYVKENDTKIEEKTITLKIERKYEIIITGYDLEKREVSPEEENSFFVKIKNIKEFLSKEYFAVCGIEKNDTILQSEKLFIPKLLPNQEYILMYFFNFSYYHEPSIYYVFCKIFDKENNLIFDIYLPVKLKEVRKYEVFRNVSQSFYVSTITIKIRNSGNIEEEIKIKEEVPIIILNFLKFEEKPEIVEKGFFAELVWKVKVLPQQERVITYKFEFWPVIVAAIVIGVATIFLIIIYYTPFVSKLVEKEKELYKIKIIAKNTSKKPIRNVIIKDSVPKIFEIVEFETKKPEIKRLRDSYQLIWVIDRLEPKEEAIISYKVRPLIKIIGEPKFPKPRMIYTIRDKKSKITKEARKK